jgi:hypothetical protein
MAVIQTNNEFRFANISNSYTKLPLGVYLLRFDSRTNEYYLTKQEDFSLPPKVYGNHDVIYRWLTSYKNNSHKNMGIILSGIKGGGKTITAQKFCVESKLPVIVINEPFEGADFINFLINPELGESIILIDEFEKVFDQERYYDKNKARDLLTLMDGTYQTRLIFLLTVNTYNLSDYFVNRLNRVKYRKDYIDLEQSVIDDVIDDMLINKEHRDSIRVFFEKINMCTFDLLVNLIKEMNLFNEDALEVGKYLNLRSEPKKYYVSEEYGGKEYRCREIMLSPDTKEISISRDDTNYLPSEMEDDYSITIKLELAEMIKIDSTSFVLKHDGFKFKFIQFTHSSLVF